MSTTIIQEKLNEVKIEQAAATSDIAAVDTRLKNATTDDHKAEEYRRGREDGIAWARDYATADQLRDLVANFEPGRDGDVVDMVDHSLCDFTSDKEHVSAVSVPHYDSPHWRGFAAGVEEILDTSGPLLNGPVPRDYRYFLKWLREVAP
jgi:hypothetical protein